MIVIMKHFLSLLLSGGALSEFGLGSPPNSCATCRASFILEFSKKNFHLIVGTGGAVGAKLSGSFVGVLEGLEEMQFMDDWETGQGIER